MTKSVQSYGFDRYYAKARATTVKRREAGASSISDDQTYRAALALDQMQWKINGLRLTQEEYREWSGFIDDLSKLLPQLPK